MELLPSGAGRSLGASRTQLILTLASATVILGGALYGIQARQAKMRAERAQREAEQASRLSPEQESLIEGKIAGLQTDLATANVRLDEQAAEAAAAKEQEPTVQGGAEKEEPKDHRFLREEELPERFRGKFLKNDLFLILEDESVARIQLPLHFDTFASPENTRLAEEVLLAFLERYEVEMAEAERRIQAGQFERVATQAEAERHKAERMQYAIWSGVRRFSDGAWAAIDFEEIHRTPEYVAADARLREHTKKFDRQIYFGVYPADHVFLLPIDGKGN